VEGAMDSIKVKGLDAVEDHGMNHYLEAVRKWNFTKPN
jgi:hypothetical protein